jgi:soluble cytochrome b562
MLDEKVSDGTATKAHEALRGEVFAFVRGLARGVDLKLDELKATRDGAVAAAKTLPEAEKKAAGDAAKKAFEEGFKQLIATALNDPKAAAEATELLEKGAALEVKA